MVKKNTKRALLMSVLSLLLCCSMLIGTTFAWFTDTVESGKNQIIAGNLDVELYWSTDADKWEKVTKDTNVFKEDTLWEPGHTEVVYLKVVNEGTLALKYNLSVKIASETPGINVSGEPFKLSDYIKFNVLKNGTAYAGRDEAREAAEVGAAKLNAPYSKGGSLQPKSSDASVHDEDIVTMVVYMPETVGNEANFMTGTNAPVINLGISLFATQFTQENDSYGNDYDKNAAWAGDATTGWYGDGSASAFTLESASDLAGLAQLVNAGNSFEGKTLNLEADVDLNGDKGVLWTPIGKSGSTFKGTFNGNGHTVSNLKAIGSKHVGLFGATYVGAHIENVNVVNAYVSGNDYVGVIVGGGYLAANCIKNCTVDNATVIATPYLMEDGVTYDGGAKAGGIIGQAYNGSVIDCTVKNSTIIAYRDLGGIAGMLAFDGSNREVEASGNTVKNVSVTYLSLNAPYNEGTPNNNLGEVVGRVGKLAKVGTNTVEDVTINEKAFMICTLEELVAFAKDVNAGNSYQGKTVILGDDIDLANMEWTPIGNSTKQFQGTFDGNGHTISNLKVTGNKSYVGLFGYTSNGAIKNLTVKNALVSGRVGVGVVAGCPYTSDFSNITVTGHVEVNGMSYVGGVGGRNAYGDWTDITVEVDESSYVKAVSTEYDPDSQYADENGYVTYRSYVGGVTGFNGEGGHTFKNITSNIDVIGDVCDIGGAFGIAHYGNNFENITVTGNVTCTGKADEIGGIAGVWNNTTGYTVSFTNCKFEGQITAADGAVTGCDLVGGAYSTSGKGVLIVDGKDPEGNWAATDAASLENALSKGGDVKLYGNITLTESIDVAEGVTVNVDLSGKTVTAGSDGYVFNNNGGVLVIEDSANAGSVTGVVYTDVGGKTIVNGGTYNAVQGAQYVFLNSSGSLTINEGTVNGGSSYPLYSYDDGHELIINDVTVNGTFGCINAYGAGTVTVNGGEFNMTGVKGKTSHIAYISGATKAVINGGTFKKIGDISMSGSGGGGVCTGINSSAEIVIYGGSFAGDYRDIYVWSKNSKITVYGGTYKFSPTSEGAKIAAGYKATKVGDVYMVISESTEVVADADKLNEALASGKDIVLSTDVKTESGTTAPYGNKYAVKLDGGVIDGNGNELYMECYGDDYGIMTSGGTVKNLTITEGCRAIMIMSAKEDIILDNVNIGGDGVLYPINTGEYGDPDVKLIVTNSTLAGWTSYAGIGSASFTNVKFEQGTYYNNIYGRVLKPYVNTTITNCEFVAHMNLDLSGLTAGHKVTFTNCTVNGQPVTADVFTVPATDAEYDTELFTVDLPSWANSIADCIDFQ